MATCKLCGAKILWIRTVKGNMPVDPQQIMYYKGQSNKDRIVTPNGEVIACEMEGDASQAIGIGYIPHWGTCAGCISSVRKTKDFMRPMKIVCFEVDSEAIQRGWGVYPDFAAKNDLVALLDILIGVHPPTVKVNEYALPEYSNRTLRLVDEGKAVCKGTIRCVMMKSGATYQIGVGYDDLVR